MPIRKRLYRSRDDRIIAGVFSGLGEYFDIDPVLLRLTYIVLLVVTAFVPGVIIYILAMFVMPPAPLLHADYEHVDVQHTAPQSAQSSSSHNKATSPSSPAKGDTHVQDAESSAQEQAPRSEEEKTKEEPRSQTDSTRRDDPLW